MSEYPIDVELLDILCCPACRGQLEYQVEQAELSCEPCGHVYPIVEGIPVLFPTDVKSRFDKMFTRFWDSEEQAETYDKFVEGSQSRAGMHTHLGELRSTLEVLGNVDGLKVLDCGCGNGRFFEHYPDSAFAVGADASLNLLRIVRKKGRCRRLVCCELEHLPFKDSVFDRTISVRVLQHVHEQRKAVSEMVRVVQHGGETVLHCYNELSSKALVKHIRQSRLAAFLNAPFRAAFRSLAPFSAWGSEYDHYSTVSQIKRWLKERGVKVCKVRGCGFGFNKWLLDEFMIFAWMERRHPQVLDRYFTLSLRAEETIGRMSVLNRFMEKFVMKGVKASRSVSPSD